MVPCHRRIPGTRVTTKLLRSTKATDRIKARCRATDKPRTPKTTANPKVRKTTAKTRLRNRVTHTTRARKVTAKDPRRSTTTNKISMALSKHRVKADSSFPLRRDNMAVGSRATGIKVVRRGGLTHRIMDIRALIKVIIILRHHHHLARVTVDSREDMEVGVGELTGTSGVTDFSANGGRVLLALGG